MQFKLIIKNIFFCLLTIFLFFEIILFFLPVREPTNSIKQSTTSILRIQQNYTYTYSVGPFFEIQSIKKTNNYGYNSNFDYELNKADILVVGDSYVDAQEVNNEEAFHHILKKKLKVNVYQLSHSSSNLAQYYKFAEFGYKNFKPKIIIYNVVANDYINSVPGKYNFNLNNGEIFLKDIDYPEKKLIHKVVLKSNFARYLYYNIRPHHRINYFLKLKNKNFEGNIPCEYTDLEFNDGKKSFDLFLKYNQKFINQGIKIIIVFDPIRSKLYSGKTQNCGFNKGEDSLAVEMRNYSIQKVKPDGIYTLDLEPTFRKAYEIDKIKFEFKNDLHWNKYTHNLVADRIIEYIEENKIEY